MRRPAPLPAPSARLARREGQLALPRSPARRCRPPCDRPVTGPAAARSASPRSPASPPAPRAPARPPPTPSPRTVAEMVFDSATAVRIVHTAAGESQAPARQRHRHVRPRVGLDRQLPQVPAPSHPPRLRRPAARATVLPHPARIQLSSLNAIQRERASRPSCSAGTSTNDAVSAVSPSAGASGATSSICPRTVTSTGASALRARVHSRSTTVSASSASSSRSTGTATVWRVCPGANLFVPRCAV